MKIFGSIFLLILVSCGLDGANSKSDEKADTKVSTSPDLTKDKIVPKSQALFLREVSKFGIPSDFGLTQASPESKPLDPAKLQLFGVPR